MIRKPHEKANEIHLGIELPPGITSEDIENEREGWLTDCHIMLSVEQAITSVNRTRQLQSKSNLIK